MNIKKYLDFFCYIIYFLSCVTFGFVIGLLNYNNIYKDEYFDIIKIKNSSILTLPSYQIQNLFFKIGRAHV